MACEEYKEKFSKLSSEEEIIEFLKTVPSDCKKELQEFVKNSKSKKEDFSDEKLKYEVQELNYIQQIKETIDKPETLKSVLKTISQLEKKNQKSIFQVISQLEEKNQKSIFQVISQLEKKNQKSIFQAISQLEVSDLKELSTDILVQYYKCFINHEQIDKGFLENDLKKLIHAIERNSSNIELKQGLRESLYRLLLKIKSEDKELLKKIDLDIESIFVDFKRKYAIQKESKYKLFEKWQKMRIRTFKERVLSHEQYKKLLKKISKYRLYSSTYEMFELVTYIVANLKDEKLFTDNSPRFSFEYYLENRNQYSKQIMLNEVFTPYGFLISKENNSNDKISLEELIEAGYTSDIEVQKRLLNKYTAHENKIYLLLALSKNRTLDNGIRQKIIANMHLLDYTYPYSEDISIIISAIEANLSYEDSYGAQIEESDTTNLFQQRGYTQFDLTKQYKAEGFEVLEFEELAYQVMYNKSKSLMLYLKSINVFLSFLNKNKALYEGNDFHTRYLLYVYGVLKQDYRLTYYVKFYLDDFLMRIKSGEYLKYAEYDVQLFIQFISIKTEIQKIVKEIKNRNLMYRIEEISELERDWMDEFIPGELRSILSEKFSIIVEENILGNLYNETSLSLETKQLKSWLEELV